MILIRMYVRPGVVRIRDRMRQTKPVRTDGGSEGKKGGVFLGLCFCVVVCPEILLQVLFFCFGSGSLFSLSLSLSFSFVEYNFCR
jgi:hypothetical protein